MYILGINAHHADASAALFKDGVMIAATEEERFTRVKHWAGFPVMAIQFCLGEAGITINQVDYIAIGRDPGAKFGRKLAYLLKHPGNSLRSVIRRLQNAGKVSSMADQLKLVDPLADVQSLRQKTMAIEHHRSHLASAFFASPFQESALLSIDGSGDFTTTMTGVGLDNQISVLQSNDFPHSVGLFYTAFTQLLGFPYYGDEYKIMGLAPYGEPKYTEKLRKVLLFGSDDLFQLNLSYFSRDLLGVIDYNDEHIPVVSHLPSALMTSEFGPARKKDEPLTQYHKDLASSVQRITEELIFHLLTRLHKKTGLDRVCIAGGVAQNSVANGKITRNTPFREVYIPSAGHDAGISMGAALYAYNHVLKQPRKPAVWSACTGARFSNEAIEKILNEKQIAYKRMEDEALFDYVSERLTKGAVVGFFNGRAEFGPRALGGRSILADPRRTDAKDLLNAKIKRRESFRPFAPSILKEYVSEYFELDEPVPFMEKVFPIKKEKHTEIPAVTHADGTGRLQTVDKEVSPRYYGLIDAFRKKTGVPILLNTSFNENEPIVNAPHHALDCYLRTSMDVLVLENCVIER